MILFFTGTGNSKFAADVLSDRLGEKTVSLNQILKNHEKLQFQSERPFIVVAPIYAWRFPRMIEKLILKSSFQGNKRIYFVGTCGSQTGKTDHYLRKICQKKGLKYKGFCGVVMPSNYIVADAVSKDSENRKILKRAIPVLEEIADSVSQETNIHPRDVTTKAALKSGIVNGLFNRFVANSNHYVVSSNCTGCGQCETWCPVNNIVLENKIPKFGKNCINCFACIQRCPQKAINWKGKTETHDRYVCPEYQEMKQPSRSNK